MGRRSSVRLGNIPSSLTFLFFIGAFSAFFLCCSSAQAYWEVTYETVGSTRYTRTDYNISTGATATTQDTTTPWASTYNDLWGTPGKDSEPFPASYISWPFGLQQYLFDSFGHQATTGATINIQGTITAVLHWRGGGQAPASVRVIEGSAAVVHTSYYIAGEINSNISGFQSATVNNGLGAATSHPHDGSWGSSSASYRLISNASHAKTIRYTTRSVRAEIKVGRQTDVDEELPERIEDAYIAYRVYVPGQVQGFHGDHGSEGIPPQAGVEPDYPHDCSGFTPDAGGLPCGSGGSGPSAPDPVNLANGQESNEPASDITVYNPYGPAATWRRHFRTNQALSGYSSPGMGTGWVHNYDITIGVDEAEPVAEDGIPNIITLIYPGGAREALQPYSPPDSSSNVEFSNIETGPYYKVTGKFNAATNRWTGVTLIWKNGTKWEFLPGSNPASGLVLHAIRNQVGRAIVFAYDSQSRLTTVSDESTSNVLLTLTYSGSILTTITDCYGRKVIYSVTTNELRTVTLVGDASGGVPPARWKYTYGRPMVDGAVLPNSPLLLATVSAPSPVGSGFTTSTIQYETNVWIPRVTALVDAYGNRTEFEYIPFNDQGAAYTRVYRKKSDGTLLARYKQYYDGYGRDTGTQIESFTGGILQTTTIEYSGFTYLPFFPAKVTRTGGTTVNTAYDYNGNVTQVSSPNKTINYEYYPYDIPMDKLKKVTEVNTSSATRTVSEFTYTAAGLLESITVPSPDGTDAVTTFTYDALGNVTQVSAPGVTASQPLVTAYSYQYDGATLIQDARIGQPVAVTDPLGHVNHYRYDTQGRLLTATDPAGYTTINTYNIVGQTATTTLPATGHTGAGMGKVAYTYLYPGGPNTQAIIYNEAAQAVRTTYTLYGKEGEVKEVGGDMADPVHYNYDEMLRLTNIVNPANNVLSSYFYDERGYVWAELLVNTNDPTDRIQRSFTYDDMGNLTRQEDAYPNKTPVTNRILRFTYDPTDFVPTGVYADDDLTIPIATFTYDSWRRQASRTDREGVQTFTYGSLADELQSVTTTYTGLPSQTISYTYKHNGARATMGTPAGTFTYGYDTTSRPTTLTNPFSETTAWAYDPVRGLLASQTSANGSANAIVASYVYDALGRRTQVTNTNASSTILSQFTVPTTGGFDGPGNRLKVTANIPSSTALSGLTTWTYDNQNRLKTEVSARAGSWNHTHAYDAAGNLTTLRGQSRTYDIQNQLISGTGLGTFQYDERGNPTTFNGVSLTWNEQDNLTKIGSGSGTMLNIGYTADGLRAWKEVPATGSVSERVYYIYDGTNPVVEITRQTTSTTTTSRISAVNTFGANGLASRTSNVAVSGSGSSTIYENVSSFFAFDERGNTSERIQSASSLGSSQTFEHAYDAYGALKSGTLGGTANPFTFGGQHGYYTDGETGLVLCTRRYYDPNTGRWLNKDPIGYDGGFNVYAYCLDNPVMAVDPMGLNLSDSPFTYLGHLLNLPNSVLGGLGGLGGTYKWDPKHEVWRVRGGVLANFNLWLGFGGITLGDVILSTTDLKGTEYEHECVHATQGRIFGIAYLPVNFYGYIVGGFFEAGETLFGKSSGYKPDINQWHDAGLLEMWADYSSGQPEKNDSAMMRYFFGYEWKQMKQGR